MDIELVNENKLKIILTPEDMELLDITCEEIDCGNRGTKRIFWDLLKDAKRQTGFDAATGKIFVEVHPYKTGGCMMYVIKKESPKGEINTVPQTAHTYEKKYKSKLYTAAKKKRLIFSFDNSENLLMVCRQLNLLGYSGKSDIFSDNGIGGAYYLYIEDNKELCLELINEYGMPVNNPFFGFYLFEHTIKILGDDAIKIFADAFV